MAFRMVIDYEGGSWQPDVDGTFSQDAFAYHVSISCNHCNNPVCTRVCPTGAMHKDELGLVWPDATKCIGCGYCTMACPYHAPHIDARLKRSSKCDGCRDRLVDGEQPVCVEACPLRALEFGLTSDLSAVAFLFLVGSYWMMAFKERFPDAVAKPWLALACLAGIALIACTSMAYNVDTVPTWDTAFTPANLVLAALLAGPVLGLLFLELAQVRPRALERALVVLAAPALVAGTVVLALHQESLSAIANNEFAASTLAPSYPAVIGAHLIVGAIALAIAGLSMKRVQSRRTTLALRATASLLALAAVFVTRIVFYHLHMTVGF